MLLGRNQGPIDTRFRLSNKWFWINTANPQENYANMPKIRLTYEHVCDIIVVKIGRFEIIYILSRYHIFSSYHILHTPAWWDVLFQFSLCFGRSCFARIICAAMGNTGKIGRSETLIIIHVAIIFACCFISSTCLSSSWPGLPGLRRADCAEILDTLSLFEPTVFERRKWNNGDSRRSGVERCWFSFGRDYFDAILVI